MKETTSELNATVVVVLAIGVLMAFFYYTLWPMIRHNFVKSTDCAKAICEKCEEPDGVCDEVTCYPKGEYGNSNFSFKCVYKG